MINETNKNQYQAQLFTNRLKKKYKELRKQMRKNRISSYRLYDRDIPEIPLSLDLYEFLPSDINNPIEAARFLSDQNARLSANEAGLEASIKERTFAVLYLYERPYQKEQNEEEEWLNLMAKVTADVLGIRENQVITKAVDTKIIKMIIIMKTFSIRKMILLPLRELPRSQDRFSVWI